MDKKKILDLSVRIVTDSRPGHESTGRERAGAGFNVEDVEAFLETRAILES